MRKEVIVSFVDIGGNVNHYCINFLYIILYTPNKSVFKQLETIEETE